jgi:hypothetical protein
MGISTMKKSKKAIKLGKKKTIKRNNKKSVSRIMRGGSSGVAGVEKVLSALQASAPVAASVAAPVAAPAADPAAAAAAEKLSKLVELVQKKNTAKQKVVTAKENVAIARTIAATARKSKNSSGLAIATQTLAKSQQNLANAIKAKTNLSAKTRAAKTQNIVVYKQAKQQAMQAPTVQKVHSQKKFKGP